MKCFYHSSDLDGHCSGAIVKYKYPECEMIGINYGQEFDYSIITPHETVYMVDFTLQPFEAMDKLNIICNLIWIDHHKTAINQGKYISGLRGDGIGACQLTWNLIFPESPIPQIVQLLAQYDVWDHSDPRTLPFQYGFRLFENTLPSNKLLWYKYFYYQNLKKDIRKICRIGETIISYEKSQNKKICEAYSFETELCGLKAICINRGFSNSKLFDSVDPNQYDIMITFCRLPKVHKWTVSLYSTKVDCSEIAKSFGGGGHKGAAGFQCEELPFKI